jgi:hypothetical protein
MYVKLFVIGLLWESYVVEWTMKMFGRCCEGSTLLHNRINHNFYLAYLRIFELTVVSHEKNTYAKHPRISLIVQWLLPSFATVQSHI